MNAHAHAGQQRWLDALRPHERPQPKRPPKSSPRDPWPLESAEDGIHDGWQPIRPRRPEQGTGDEDGTGER